MGRIKSKLEVASSSTDGNGWYEFQNVIAGDYFIQFIDNEGREFSPMDQGADDALDSDADAFGTTGIFTISAGEFRTDIDAGLIPVGYGQIGDYVWEDANSNGIQDPGEIGIADVYVELYDSFGSWVASTSTDGDGWYEFQNVIAGDYFVQFIDNEGREFSPMDQGADDALDSDADAYGTTGTFTISAGEFKTDIDAGLMDFPVPPPPGMGSIGGRVFDDADLDGIQHPGEVGIQGITVFLFDEFGSLIDQVLSDANGNYQFQGVAPGNYYVVFDQPADYVFSPKDQGGDDTIDSDADSSGTTALFTLLADEEITDLDAGLYRTF